MKIKMVFPSKSLIHASRYFFALPWLVIGVQHFMYADFLENLVPAYMPVCIFWVYSTGVGMMAAGLSIIIRVKSELAATCLVTMLVSFINPASLIMDHLLIEVNSNPNEK